MMFTRLLVLKIMKGKITVNFLRPWEEVGNGNAQTTGAQVEHRPNTMQKEITLMVSFPRNGVHTITQTYKVIS